MKQNYQVLLYYHYVHIEDPESYREEHMKLCLSHNLLGRIIVSHEGINGTLSGLKEDTENYMKAMHEDPRFASMPFKIDPSDKHVFSKMHVRVKTELVNLSLANDIDPHKITGEYVKPAQFFEEMQDENTIVIDARNDYEYDLGHFRGAIRPDIRVFRDLPEWIKENKEMLENKRVLTYCTGGVRCEKFSGWLMAEGLENVGQLEGGIVTYGYDDVAQGQLWDGQCYAFDQRIAVPIHRTEHVIVGKDHITGEPCERYVNCANPDCNEQIIMSEETESKYLRACSHECRVSPRNRYVIENLLSLEEVEARLKKITN